MLLSECFINVVVVEVDAGTRSCNLYCCMQKQHILSVHEHAQACRSLLSAESEQTEQREGERETDREGERRGAGVHPP